MKKSVLNVHYEHEYIRIYTFRDKKCKCVAILSVCTFLWFNSCDIWNEHTVWRYHLIWLDMKWIIYQHTHTTHAHKNSRTIIVSVRTMVWRIFVYEQTTRSMIVTVKVNECKYSFISSDCVWNMRLFEWVRFPTTFIIVHLVFFLSCHLQFGTCFNSVLFWHISEATLQLSQ